jgi:hypothetical protein
MREQRVVDIERTPETIEQVRDMLADNAHITPLKRPNHLLNSVRKQLTEEKVEWAESFISPTINKQERANSDAKRKEARDKGVIRTDLTQIIQWAQYIASRTKDIAPLLAVALSVFDGRRQSELISPKYTMIKIGKHRITMSGQAKQTNDKPVSFDTICTATVFLKRRELLQSMMDWTGDEGRTIRNINNLKNASAKILRTNAAFTDLREKYL